MFLTYRIFIGYNICFYADKIKLFVEESDNINDNTFRLNIFMKRINRNRDMKKTVGANFGVG